MASYLNGKRISGIRDFPAYTWDEYHALPVAQRPKVWKCKDRDYTQIPWNVAGTVTGTTQITLPTNWLELQIDVYNDNVHIPLYFNRAWLETYNYVKSGYYFGSSSTFGASVTITTNAAYLQSVTKNNSDVTASSKLKVLWR